VGVVEEGVGVDDRQTGERVYNIRGMACHKRAVILQRNCMVLIMMKTQQ